MKFDKLYVLAKGGLCVYSGLPQNLGNYLKECDIICTEIQVPIEVLLKIASNGTEDEMVIKLANKTSQEKCAILESCRKETKLMPNGIPFKSKNFKLLDVWYLLMRSMTYIYISQWKSSIFQLLLYIFYPLIFAQMYNSDIGKPDGCFSFLLELNTTCSKELDDNSLLDQNTKYIATTSIYFMFISLSLSITSFSKEVKIFVNEHQNSKFDKKNYLAINSCVRVVRPSTQTL